MLKGERGLSAKEYAKAGADRNQAAATAAKKDHDKAAKQYGEAQHDFNLAADAARNAGDTKNADKYDMQAKQAGTNAKEQEAKAYHARHLQFQHALNAIAVRHDDPGDEL